jgi:ribosomal protein S18 acetylase RimI-like enzyme
MQFTQQHTRIRAGSPCVILNRQSQAVISAAIIRDGVPADCAQATEIQRAAFGHLHWDFCDEPFKVAELPEGEMMAYLIWRWTFTGEFEIVSIATHPKHQRKGVASALIHDFCLTHRGDVFLEVEETNQGAIALYEWQGFEKTGVRHVYYENTTNGAVVMNLRNRLAGRHIVKVVPRYIK